jgi:hypothetical protein
VEDTYEMAVAKRLMGAVEFVSYDGRYPNLCAGELVVRVYGATWTIHRLSSGGSVTFDKEWNENVSDGDWSIEEWPDGFPEEAKKDVVDLVNEKVTHGCCGGCV